MKITIGTYTLADDLDAQLLTGPGGLQISGADQVQHAALLRATSMASFNRGNRQTALSFTVVRRHASLRDAEHFLLTHERDLPRSGLVTLTARSPGGAEVSVYLPAASVTPQSRYAGLTTRHSYTIQGGALLTAPPV
ncbi:hypothetical protein DB346_07515 [Verrucomicrobia bacterium LW23]|nr:hypothetical protein DB346_07515 [Verrucomicrobia bacterium LW23]